MSRDTAPRVTFDAYRRRELVDRRTWPDWAAALVMVTVVLGFLVWGWG